MSTDWIRADWPAPDTILAGTTLRNGDLASLELPGQPCWLKQVHGADVVVAGHFDEPPEADGSIGRSSKDVCVVRTADCLPVLFCSADGNEIAAAHAGWRGLAAGVLEATVTRMNHRGSDLLAWLGPAISQPAFEVGEEVRQAFVAQDAGAAACFAANDRGRWQADLYALARRRLAAMGGTDVYGGPYCTVADTERFYSYRRSPECGRMVSFVAMTALENT